MVQQGLQERRPHHAAILALALGKIQFRAEAAVHGYWNSVLAHFSGMLLSSLVTQDHLRWKRESLLSVAVCRYAAHLLVGVLGSPVEQEVSGEPVVGQPHGIPGSRKLNDFLLAEFAQKQHPQNVRVGDKIVVVQVV